MSEKDENIEDDLLAFGASDDDDDGFPFGGGDSSDSDINPFGDDDDDDVFADLEGGFPSEPDDEDVDPLEHVDGVDEEEEEFSFDEEEGDEEAEDEVEDEDFLSDYIEDDEEEEGQSDKSKANMIFYAAAAASAVVVLGFGYMTFAPMFSSSAPAQPPRVTTPANMQQPNSQGGMGNLPVDLPKAQVPTLPAPATSPNVQTPGLPTNIVVGQTRPNGLDGNQQNLPNTLGFDDVIGGANKEKPTDDTGIKIMKPSMPVVSAEIVPPVKSVPVPEKMPAAEKVEDTDDRDLITVMTRLDEVLSKLDRMDDKFTTTDEVRDLVGKAVDERVKTLEEKISSIQIAEPSGDTGRVSELEKRIETMQDQFAKIDKRLTELSEAQKAPQSAPKVPEKVVTEKSPKPVQRPTEIKPEPKPEVSAPAKADEETLKLKRQIAAQKQELMRLKANGANYRPVRKPAVHTDYRLAGMSSDTAWIETPSGVYSFRVGDTVPGIGRIESFKAIDGSFSVLTETGMIMP